MNSLNFSIPRYCSVSLHFVCEIMLTFYLTFIYVTVQQLMSHSSSPTTQVSVFEYRLDLNMIIILKPHYMLQDLPVQINYLCTK